MRKYSRIQFDTDAQLETPQQRFAVHIIDISIKGVLLEVPEDAHTPDNARFSLHIPLSDESLAIHLQAVPRHREGRRLGCEWVAIDLDSMTSLRRLLELNLADNRLLERELGQLCHG
ncbi:MAG: PilZ domain-containing protein [Pseudomonadota bacterium]